MTHWLVLIFKKVQIGHYKNQECENTLYEAFPSSVISERGEPNLTHFEVIEMCRCARCVLATVAHHLARSDFQLS